MNQAVIFFAAILKKMLVYPISLADWVCHKNYLIAEIALSPQTLL